MEVSGVVSAVVIGLLIGVLGRLLVPGRQHIGVLWTLVAGIAAALLGSALAALLGVAATDGPDWTEWFVQIALAAGAVAALNRALAPR
ncbi:GlsB/YeaQ/YmgE family stress response membrane protein [Streptomyces sp. NPDC006193]|uniref:GlsB/YeaQ/YmgE family stress response membrane protein n=1 Tax=Streptomyces sp. NPDC006193 TaxID=3155717 RepID=UPI0033B104EA